MYPWVVQGKKAKIIYGCNWGEYSKHCSTDSLINSSLLLGCIMFRNMDGCIYMCFKKWILDVAIDMQINCFVFLQHVLILLSNGYRGK